MLATAYFDDVEGNLRAIRDELARRKPRIPVTVLARRAEPGVPSIGFELLAAFHLARARVFVVDDYFFPIYAISVRAGTTIVQVWHACGAFKKFGYSRGDKTIAASARGGVRVHTNYDVCLASSEATAACYAEAFGQPLDQFEWSLGIPRTDVLFGDGVTDTRGQVRRRYGLSDERIVVLYAPTYRGNEAYAARHPLNLDLRLLRRELGDGHVVLLRLHPLVRSGFSIEGDLSNFVVDVSGHPDVNELMLATDILITDYSSVIFEFALLGRPIAFFAPDLDEYERERGLYFDLRTEGPGPVFETTAELAAYLRAGSFDTSSLERFRQKWMAVADGHSSERFVDRLVVPALEGREIRAA